MNLHNKEIIKELGIFMWTIKREFVLFLLFISQYTI